MGLESFKGGAGSDKAGIKYSKDKLNDPGLCPECGSEDTEEWYWGDMRCNDKGCDIVVYTPVSYGINEEVLV